MKKIITIITILALVVILAVAGGMIYSKQIHAPNVPESSTTVKKSKFVDYQVVEKINFRLVKYVLPKLEKTDLVAICHLESIEEAQFMESDQIHLARLTTAGKLNIDKVLKGDDKIKQVDFVKSGGVINMAEYYQKYANQDQKQRWSEKYSESEMKDLYVAEDAFESIHKLVDGKKYLCYLNDDKDSKKYRLITLPEILRQVKQYDNKLVIKDYQTDEWQTFANIEEFANSFPKES